MLFVRIRIRRATWRPSTVRKAPKTWVHCLWLWRCQMIVDVCWDLDVLDRPGRPDVWASRESISTTLSK